jgi:hypothetical protein
MNETVYFALKSGSTVTSGETSIPAWQKEEMQSITIRGPMIYDYIDITQGNTSWALFYSSTISDYASVTLETNTLFVCAFDHTLFSGDSSIGASGTGRNGNSVVMTDSLCVCRRPNDSNAFERVATIPLDDSTKDAVIYDYSVKNQEKYQYYLLYMWGGNYVRGPEGYACLIDPAVSVGHVEADLAMTELFGGFAPAFYDAYRGENEIRPGYSDRRDLYNLYHLLNHLNLFGGSYYSAVMRIVKRYR